MDWQKKQWSEITIYFGILTIHCQVHNDRVVDFSVLYSRNNYCMSPCNNEKSVSYSLPDKN